jgi:dTDP-4-amino-4,6-dideoxy-D-galactose acyltransferase
MKYKLLDWDTEFLDIKVGEILLQNLSENELTEILHDLKVKSTQLVYWSSSKEMDVNSIKSLGGILAAKKITFCMDFYSDNSYTKLTDLNTEPYHKSMPVKDIESLAIQSGKYSRFAVDPRFPKDKFTSLYKTWINKSLQKEIASEVLVIRDKNKVAGMVTLGEKNRRGDIGLIAVDSNYRGRSYGTNLVYASQKWFVKNGFKVGQVVTQEANLPACNLYTKCGYSINQIEYLYHFWL